MRTLRDRLQGLRSLGRCFDVDNTVRIQCGRGGYNNKQGDDI